MKDVIIIGAGIAGLTASIYLKRAGKSVLIIDKDGFGGKIINSTQVDNYPGLPGVSGYDLMEKVYDQALSFGAELVYEDVVKIEGHSVITRESTYKGKTIIICTGSKDKKLNVEGEEEGSGKYIHSCATCDGNFYKGKTVAIVGAGNTAVQDAIELSSMAEKVYMIVRGDGFPKAEAILVERMMEIPNIEYIYEEEIKKIIKGDKVNLILKNGDLEVDGVFLAIGSNPDTDAFDLDKENGYIKVDEDMKTSVPYIFAAGDCTTIKVKQLVTAASSGAVAAISAINYLNNMKEETWN